MKITHINFAKGFRGGERQTQLLIHELSQKGYEQTLLVRKGSELIHRCQAYDNLTIIEIAKPYVLSIFKLSACDLIHAHETKALQFAYVANLILHIPYIVTRRVDNALKTNWLNKKMYAKAFKSVALSKAIEQEILRISPKAHTDIIPSAYSDISIDKTQAETIKERFSGKFLIGNVGALDDAHKGQSFLIDAARELSTSHPDMHFIFLGSGIDEQRFKDQAKGLENITFEGFVNNVNDYIACFDLFVFPSRHEGLGSILFDVMQLSVPIIATKVGGIPDIIENEYNGILVPACDTTAIVNNITTLYHDQSKRIALANHALLNIDKFSPSAMAQSYENLYHQCLD